MNASRNDHPSRREFIRTTGQFAAASALAGVALPHVHAAEDNTIRLALIGCGGRGTGAVRDALSVSGDPVELHAMADLVENRLEQSHQVLREQFGSKIEVPRDRRFVGFDGYRKAID